MATLASAPEATAAKPSVREITHWINGAPVRGTSSRFGDVFHPATGTVQARVPLASDAEVNAAVQAAAAAFPDWSAQPPLRRARVLFRLRDIFESRMDEVAALLNREHGKVFSDAKGEVMRGLENIEFATGIPELLKGEFTEQVGTGIDTWSMRQPLGVVAGITPFNFPAMVPLWMFPLAIACGNTFVLKPSERDPSASILLAEMLKEAGLPDGVFNVIHGDKTAVDAILAHPTIQAVTFVGSTAIAEYVYSNRHKARQARASPRRRKKSHDRHARRRSRPGRRRPRRFRLRLRRRALHGHLRRRRRRQTTPPTTSSPNSKHRIANLSVGDGAPELTNGEADFGPLITKRAPRQSHQLHRPRQDRRRRARRRRPRTTTHCPTANGFFLGACLFDHVKPEMRIYKEEIFGPVLGVVRVNNFEKALELINEHEYGNGTSIFTRDGDTARDFGRRVQAGMVGINVPIPVPMAFHSFGGWKRSLFGDHSIYGPEGVRFYTRLKTITARWPTGIRTGVDTSMPTLG